MPRRKLVFVTNEVYHVFNRGVEYRDIFLEKKNYVRFIELLDYYQWTRSIKFSSTQSNTPLPEWNIESAKLIDVNCYCLMPNHFHLVLRQKKENGLSKFLRVIQDSYTRYFNIKYERKGPLFQGLFKAVHIQTDEQLLHVSRYIHLNPVVSGIVNNPLEYHWSSYKVFINGGDELIKKDDIIAFFQSPDSYSRFVNDHLDYAKNLEKIKHEAIDL